MVPLRGYICKVILKSTKIINLNKFIMWKICIIYAFKFKISLKPFREILNNYLPKHKINPKKQNRPYY